MNLPFRECRINERFRQELEDLTRSGQNAELLGPGDIGKSYLLDELAIRLGDEGTTRVIKLEFPHQPVLAEPYRIRELVGDAVKEAWHDCAPVPDDDDQLLAADRPGHDL